MDSLYSHYANALFSIALEENKVDYYKDEVKMLKDVINDNIDILHLFSSYFVTDEEKFKTVDEIYPNNENIKNFIKIIIKNRRANNLLKIFDEFIKNCNEYNGVKEGIIYSVNELDNKTITKLEDASNGFIKENKISYFSLGEEGSSMVQAIAITFGTGILNLPPMIYKSGFIPSLIIFILCSAAQQYTLNLLVSSAVNRKKFDYFELTEDTKGIHWAKAYAICSTTFMIITIIGYNQAINEFINHIWLIISRKNYDEKYVTIEIEDDGCGMKKDVVEKAAKAKAEEL